MDQPETEREQPAPSRFASSDQIFHAHVNDRTRDHWFNDPTGEDHSVQRRHRQCDRMRDRETGDDLERRPESLCHDQQREQKQQMIIAGENVPHAQRQKSHARGPVSCCFGVPTSLTQDRGPLRAWAEQPLQYRRARLIGHGQKLPVTERQSREETGAQFERSARIGNEVESELDIALVVESPALEKLALRRIADIGEFFDRPDPRRLRHHAVQGLGGRVPQQTGVHR